VNTSLSQRLFSVVFQQSNSLFNIGPRYMKQLLLADVNSQQIKIISMKNLMIPAVALVMFMASCDPVRWDAEEMCSKLYDIYDAQKGNDMAKIDSLQKEYDAEMEKMKTLYPAGSDDAKRFDAIVNSCFEKYKQSDLMADGEYICGKIRESVEISKSGDKAKISEFSKKYEAEMKELEKKYAKGTPEEKELEKIIKACIEESMKAKNEN